MRVFPLLLTFTAPQAFALIHLSLTPNTQPFTLSPLITSQDLLKHLETLPTEFTNPSALKRKLKNNRVAQSPTTNNDGCSPQSWSFDATLGDIKTKIEVDLSSTSSNEKPEEKLFIHQRSDATKWKHSLTQESIDNVKEGCVKGSAQLDIRGKKMDVRVLKCTANIASYEAVLPSCIKTTPTALLDLHEQQKLHSVLFFPSQVVGVLSLGGPFLNDKLDAYAWESTAHLPSASSGAPIMVTEVKVGRYTKLLEFRPAVLLPTFPFVYVSSDFELERLYSVVTGAVRLAEVYPEYQLLAKKGWDVWGVPCWEVQQKVELKFGDGWQQVDARGPRVRSGGGLCLGVFVARVGSDLQSSGVGKWVLGWPAMRGAEWVFDSEKDRIGFMRAENFKDAEATDEGASKVKKREDPKETDVPISWKS
ncbi:hypothetical protein BJ508DRAFT_373230 [Ascobolus immersus RN42]|uniref:Peptidase A1 domain-containing protein n=1 Tax=Ascobolus immersus RN42 TaxID=1160509 RepID=A0A3N4IPC2_ASCIM|nr:hypothetical protein BJ508DRAFT_373230 [Ascobolus immersus RN42]